MDHRRLAELRSAPGVRPSGSSLHSIYRLARQHPVPSIADVRGCAPGQGSDR